MLTTQQQLDNLSFKIIGCAIAVHKELGPGLLESVYEKCLTRELQLQNLKTQSQIKVNIGYKGIDLLADLRIDIIVEDLIILELKSTEGLSPVHESTLLTYMKLMKKPKGILINFNCVNIFKEGQKTLVNEYYAALGKN